MKAKQSVKVCIDIAMTLGLLFLMGYHLWGDTAHEWVGAGIFVLFILHHILNWRWWAGLFKGKYSAVRILQVVIDLLTLAAMYCREHNLMAGIGNNQFAPESNLTRAQFATVLYRIEGTPAVTGTDAFTDTPDGAWYSDAVLWVSQQNLISGYGGGLFGPNDPVSREQMTTILWRYAGSPAVDGADDYTDEVSIASYAAAAVDWASVNSIVVPASTGVFAPKSEASRAHIAAALMNYSRSQQTAPTTPAEPVPSEGTNVLIAYFSATNNTEGIANHLDAILDADLHEITPEQPYTAADLNYNSDCRANDEQNDPSAHYLRQCGQHGAVRCDFPGLSHLVGAGPEDHQHLLGEL